jgi:hypothetical protein
MGRRQNRNRGFKKTDLMLEDDVGEVTVQFKPLSIKQHMELFKSMEVPEDEQGLVYVPGDPMPWYIPEHSKPWE